MKIGSPEHKSWCKYMLRDKCFHIAFTNLTNFIKGRRNDKTLNTFFPCTLNPVKHLPTSFWQKYLRYLTGCYICLFILKCTDATVRICFSKIAVLKSFAIFTEKYLCSSLSLTKL